MFKKKIISTPLTTATANSYFKNIRGSKYDEDDSFLATLRALVAPRIKEDEKIQLQFGSTRYGMEIISEVSKERVVNAICANYDLDNNNGQIIVHSFCADHDDNTKIFELINEKFISLRSGYYRLDKLREFYRKSFRVECFINPDTKNVILFVEDLNIKKLHYLQVSIFAILPWYFDPGTGVSELEMELIYSLRETSSEKYEDCIRRIAEQYDFRSQKIHQLLSGFETRFDRIQRDDLRGRITDIDERIARLNSAIGTLFAARNTDCATLMGYERKIAETGDDSEIMDYFLCNDKLVLEDVNDQYMSFSAKDYITYFDSEIAERAINNTRSFVYRNDSGGYYRSVPAEKMKKLMWEIFVEDAPRLKIKVCAAYKFQLNGNVVPLSNHSFDCEFAEYMPNPHIDRYSCMGNYLATIHQLLLQRNYIGALEQCIASCKSLNWGDSCVMKTFMETMWGVNAYNNRCIELPDGRVVKPIEAIQWLDEEDGKIEENQNTMEEEI